MHSPHAVACGTSAHFQAIDLPVVQIKPSHNLVIDSSDLPSGGALAVIPAYVTMAESDQLDFTWQGYFDGEPIEWHRTVTVSAGQVRHPIQVHVPRSEVLIIEGSYAEVSYRLTPAQGGVEQLSPVQTFTVGVPPDERLPQPRVLGPVPGEPVDPVDFPQGLLLRVAYPTMRDGDQVVLYGDGATSAGSFVDSLLIGTDHAEDGWADFHIPPEWLTVNVGTALVLFYQFARAGEGRSSALLTLDIRTAEPLPPPIVERAVAEGEQYQGVLQAQHAFNGVYVRVPDSAPVASGDQLIMHWQGHPAGGQHVAEHPVSDQEPRRFFIPASAVPANMGAGESKRFDVVFERVRPVGAPRLSTPFGLRIVPLDQARYPLIQWDRLGGSTRLSLQTVPAEGEPLRLDRWPFMARGQLLSVEVTGVDSGGTPARVLVRNALPVTEQEATAGAVTAKVPRAFLAGLKLDQYLTASAAVSFDGGETLVRFLNNSGVRLVP